MNDLQSGQAKADRGCQGPLWSVATKSQGRLPFSVWVRRNYRWWPGPERYGGLINRLIAAAILSPGVVWAALSFGWVPALFVVAEVVVVAEIVYRVANGNFLLGR